MDKADASFFEKVYNIVCEIPPGRVSTYGAIANYIGSKSSARMVGWAMNACHSQQKGIPAHRVVNRLGVLTGKLHFHGINMMQQLLEEEGINIKEDKIINFNVVFWDPTNELKKNNV